ncbi:addiction module antidote protein [Mesorhizobium sp. WSM4904]|uniref:addiction module antidote protein n=1 Tax=Mesorhizobium sp. WSM4904 TaxID=3038545 RepID=UPI0024187AAB|nr:addiction module antidote protein [Mesorhizobium sp. WSM4904]WFP61917.1 putative addiction module antidote protein [Mesorhizobium sp. WSM4904]
MPLETTRFDILDYLKTPEERLAYVEAAFEDGEPMIITHTLSSVARSIGLNIVAREAGMTPQALLKALGEIDPPLSTLLAVLRALGLQLSAKPIDQR